MPLMSTAVVVLINITMGVLVFGGAMAILANLGGLLERATSGSWLTLPVSYWPSHVIKALLFSVPTGLIVLLLGLHMRASVVVIILTCFSIYLGSGSYVYVGLETRPSNLSGVFDWILGYEANPVNTSFNTKFIRDFAGMSLRGLTWTGPQGYILHHMGFGWQYSLSGSLMGMIYYLGSHSPATAASIFSARQSYSQYYWGCWVWLVLMTSCAAQLVHRIRVWIYRKSPFLGFRPFSRWEQVKYNSLNYSVTMVMYEVLLFLLNVLLATSLVFYSLVNEDNQKSKGQTFFCLFTSVLSLTFAQGWVWNGLHRNWRRKRARCCWCCSGPQSDHFDMSLDATSGNSHPRITISNLADEDTTLLWPYSHPERSCQERLVLPEGRCTNAMMGEKVAMTSGEEDRRVSRLGAAFLIFWPEVEKWIWMDIFAWIRHIVGVVSFLFTLLTVVFVVVAAILDSDYPRYGGTESTLQ